MAEQLGEAVLRLSVDDTALNAGLQRAQRQAGSTGQAINGAFNANTRSIQGLEARLDGLRTRFKAAEIGSQEFRKLRNEIKETEGALNDLQGSGGGGSGGGLLAALGFSGGAAAALAVGAAVVGIGAAAVQSAGSVQRLNAAFTGLTGSAEAARQLRQDLFTLSKTTPFKNDEILTAAQRFLAVGVEADKLQGTINRIGSLSAQSGQPLERLALIYAQVYAKGRLQGEENLQLLEAGVDLTQELAIVTGKSGEALREAMSKGQISVEDFNKAVVLATGNMSALEGAGKAVDVAFNNIGDNVGQVFGGFAQSIAPALAAAFNVVNKVLEQAFPSLKDIEEAFKPLTVEAERLAKSLESNPELIAAIAAAVREWGTLIVDVVANNLRTVNNILDGLDGRVLVDGLLTAELVARRLLLTIRAVGATAAKNAELTARGITNPLKFGIDIAQAGGFRQFLEKEYKVVQEKWSDITNAQPLPVNIGSGGNNQLEGELSSKPGLTDPAADLARKARAQFELNDLTAKGFQDELRYRGQLLGLELESLRNRQAISATTRTQLAGQQAILAAQRQVAQAEIALNAELAKPAEQRSSAEVDTLLVKVEEANAGVRKAYLDAGISLVQNARTASDALKSAQQNLSSIQRGGFEFLNRKIQQQEINRARAAIQPLVDRGVIRQGIDISTPDKLFRLASFAEQLAPAQKKLEEAVRENALATKALIDKDWQVNVNVRGASGTATGDVVGAINGGL